MRAHIHDERRGQEGKSETFITQIHGIIQGSSMKAIDAGRLRAIAIVKSILLGYPHTPALFALHMHQGALSIGLRERKMVVSLGWNNEASLSVIDRYFPPGDF
ncbi:hypothetical protein F4823DRAFT_492545 [Ustulina deusta]|nr:hypothetical protein F4823DRAFT_492545 [Ustulina deusta]